MTWLIGFIIGLGALLIAIKSIVEFIEWVQKRREPVREPVIWGPCIYETCDGLCPNDIEMDGLCCSHYAEREEKKNESEVL